MPTTRRVVLPLMRSEGTIEVTFEVASDAGKWDEGTAKVQVPTRRRAIPAAEPLR